MARSFRWRALIIDRKTGTPKTIFIPRASVSVIGGIQPEMYKRLMTKENRSNRMSARLLVCMPPRKPRKWTEASIHPDVELAIEQMIEKLLSLEMHPAATEFDDPQPVLVDLSKDAKQLFIAFFNEHAQEQSAESGELSATWSKLEAYAPRFALVHHQIRWANGEIPPDQERFIDAESMQAAITLVRWFANEARRVHAMLSESPEEQQVNAHTAMPQDQTGGIQAKLPANGRGSRVPQLIGMPVKHPCLLARPTDRPVIRPDFVAITGGFRG